MRPSLRFLALTALAWGGLRTAMVGAFPGAELFRIDRSEAKVLPIAATQFPPIEPIEAAVTEPSSPPQAQAASSYSPVALIDAIRALLSANARAVAPARATATPLADALQEPRAQFFSPAAQLDEWPLSQVAFASRPRSSSLVSPPESVPPLRDPNAIDRVQLTAWTLLRPQSTAIAGSQPLASGGSLGASQAGARLTYNLTRQIAATLRMSSDVGRRGGEAAAGLRVQPLAGIPLWIDAERRQRIGEYGGGRSAFALFFEGGVWDRPVPLHFLLNGYLQGGVVGARSRDKFIDGALTLTRPVYKQFSAGLGVWGGAQPGIYRVDAGPRITMQVRRNIRVHFDWRQRLAGNAAPGSGPAVTLAGDF